MSNFDFWFYFALTCKTKFKPNQYSILTIKKNISRFTLINYVIVLQEVSCNCKTSRTLVPCGMEKSTKPPKCKQKCKNPPDCHHESRSPHSCHFGPCQPCKQICQNKMACGHSCPKPCHDQVLVKVQDNKKATTPWENKGIFFVILKLSCIRQNYYLW